ncbi:MAG: zinc ribbon domain-containing protein [Anaerolineaceae bacterium]
MNLTNLFELQNIDTQLDTFQAELTNIDAQIGKNGAVRNANQAVLSIQSEIEFIQRELNLIIDEIERKKIKLSQSDSTLYSGKVQNPKELQDLQQEIQYLKNNIADLEDKQLNQMIKLEEIQASHNSAKNSYNGIASQFETAQSQMAARKETLHLDSERLHRKRDVVLASIEPELVTRYEVLRKRKNGLAIAALENGACSACGTQLTPSERQEVHQLSKIFLCPTCGRILYHK